MTSNCIVSPSFLSDDKFPKLDYHCDDDHRNDENSNDEKIFRCIVPSFDGWTIFARFIEEWNHGYCLMDNVFGPLSTVKKRKQKTMIKSRTVSNGKKLTKVHLLSIPFYVYIDLQRFQFSTDDDVDFFPGSVTLTIGFDSDTIIEEEPSEKYPFLYVKYRAKSPQMDYRSLYDYEGKKITEEEEEEEKNKNKSVSFLDKSKNNAVVPHIRWKIRRRKRFKPDIRGHQIYAKFLKEQILPMIDSYFGIYKLNV